MVPVFEFSNTALIVIYLTIAVLIPVVFMYFDNEEMHRDIR
jgi:hypothetical protein